MLKDGTRLLPFPMDWPSFSTMTADGPRRHRRVSADGAARIATGCRSPTRTLLPLYLWGKFKMLILGADPPDDFFPGNAGIASRGTVMKTILKWAAITVVLLAVVGFLRSCTHSAPFFMTRPKIFGEDMERRRRQWTTSRIPPQRAIAERGRTS